MRLVMGNEDAAQTGIEARARFEALFELHHARIAAYVRRRAGQGLVEDVVSETFLVAWRSLDGLGGDPLPWLYGVAHRVLANTLRAQQRRLALTQRLAGESNEIAEDVYLSAEVSGPMRAALLSLGAREREALLLVAWEELTPQEAAVALGCSRVAFRARLYRARGQLADALGRSGRPGSDSALTEEVSGT
jgi:RNA polymerase sigma-70 factor (ECF subfamily)